MTWSAFGLRGIAMAVVGVSASLIAVTACGSVGGNPSAAPSHARPPATSAVQATSWTTACRSIPAATQLLVTRAGVGLPPPQGPRARTIVTSVAVVRHVEHALCLLPARPPGTYHCPADFGPQYSLRFWVGRQSLPTVNLDPTGCELVSGMPGSMRWTARSPQFWRILGQALGLGRPSVDSFSGQPGAG
jgi:hypothetical protein